MRGPSSSHTAASARIAEIVRMSLGATPARAVVDFDVNGSLAVVHEGQGTDLGLVCGFLGMPLTAEGVDKYWDNAKAAGLELKFREYDYGAEHPNTYRITAETRGGTARRWEAISTGGGMIEMTRFEDFPVSIRGDFYELLLEQEEPEARDIALRYERYVKGALSFFNHQSNVGFENRITNVDFKDLSQNMRVFGMLTALEAVRNRMYANFERGVTTWLYIDEVQSLFGHPAIISYFSKFWAEGRKFNLICTGITQNSTYMLEHEDARNMVLNSDFVLLHKQSHLDRKSWVDLLALSAQEEGYIDDSIKAGEGLLVAGGVRVPLKDDFPKGALYDLFNTKPEEIAQIKRAQAFARAREGGDA